MKLARTLNPLRWQVDDGVTPGEPYVTGNEEDSP
jgi:hypothetical protein